MVIPKTTGLLYLRSEHFLNLHHQDQVQDQVQDLDPNPGQLPAGCIQDKVTRIGANGDDGNRPQNVLDNNFNTRWSNYGSGSNIQIDLGKKDIALCCRYCMAPRRR